MVLAAALPILVGRLCFVRKPMSVCRGGLSWRMDAGAPAGLYVPQRVPTSEPVVGCCLIQWFWQRIHSFSYSLRLAQ
jgi:hypothetical protein